MRVTMVSWLPVGALWCLAVLAGCSSGSGSVADSGSTTLDTGTDVAAMDVGIDSGTPVNDTGTDTGANDLGTDTSMDTGTDTGTSDAAVDVPTDTGPALCNSNTDCTTSPTGSVCDTTTGLCVQCIASADTCPAAQHCDPGSDTCVAGCSSDVGCTTDVADGGAGDSAVASGMYCDTSAHTCVQCMTDAQCPAGLVCAGELCVTGCASDHGCASGQTCCGAACVNTVTNVADCGGCGMACSIPNGVPACVSSTCAVGSCTAPFADCDGLVTNGCETYTGTAANNCGSCGTVCPSVPNATPSCTAGACGYVCNVGYADCDGLASNGCEVNLATSAANCGSCTNACSSGVCAGATCQAPACNDGVQNGNETDVDCGGGTCPACALCDHCLVGTDCAAGTCNTTNQCTYSTTVYIDWLQSCNGPDGIADDLSIPSVPAGNYLITALPSGGDVWSVVTLPSEGWSWGITCANLAVPTLRTPAGVYYASAAAAFAALPTTTATVSYTGGTLSCFFTDSHCGDNQGGVRFSMQRTCP